MTAEELGALGWSMPVTDVPEPADVAALQYLDPEEAAAETRLSFDDLTGEEMTSLGWNHGVGARSDAGNPHLRGPDGRFRVPDGKPLAGQFGGNPAGALPRGRSF